MNSYQATSILFDYPKQATFGRTLAKNKIYEHGSPSPRIKDLFIRQIEQITWQYKLAPETINLASTFSVPEIQVFNITIKDGELKNEVLRCIDLAIPFPLIFEVIFDGKIKCMASYKRPSDADATRWVVSDYFETLWLAKDSPRTTLPIALDLGSLYEKILAPLMPYPNRSGESVQHQVERIEQIVIKQREIEKCETNLHNEKQFNRQVEINAVLRNLKHELESLESK